MTSLLVAWAATSLAMLVTWQVQRQTGNAGWVDVSWAASMGAIGVAFAVVGDASLDQRMVLGLMVALWAGRLTRMIAARVASGPEDARYRNMRDWLGKWQSLGLFVFFQLQAAIVVVLAVPWLIAANNPASPQSPWILLAVLIWLVSFCGEAAADQQLERHRSNPDNRGVTCRRGLWRYSRHPNYFFEWLHWWSYLPLCVGAPNTWLGLLGPLVMYLFLRHLTGVPHSERQALLTRGEDYRRYRDATSAFFPWFPKGESHESCH